MAVSLELKWDDVATLENANFTEDTATVRYFATSDDPTNDGEPEVRTAAKAAIPDFYEGLVFTKLETRRFGESDYIWECIATYEAPNQASSLDALEVGDVRWGIKTGSSQTLKRRYSLGLLDEVVANDLTSTEWQLAGTAAANLVGWNKDEDGVSVEGKDYSIGAIEISAQTVIDNATAVGTYLVDSAGYAAQNAINSDAWNGFAATTLRITNFSATERAGTLPNWDISYTFIFDPVITNLDLGGGLPVIAVKPGHALVDVNYRRKEQTIGGKKRIFSVPLRAAVHQWYPTVSFATNLLL